MRMRSLIAGLIALLVIVGLVAPMAFADEADASFATAASNVRAAVFFREAVGTNTDRIVDEADVLTDAEEAAFEEKAAEIVARQGQDVVVYIANIGDQTSMNVADDFYDYSGYGIGAEKSGVLLLVAPDTRDWWISTTGGAISVFNDRGIAALGELIVEPLSQDSWSGGVDVFLSQADAYYSYYATHGKPMNGTATVEETLFQWIAALSVAILGGIGAMTGIVSGILKPKMANIGVEPTVRASFTSDSVQFVAAHETLLSRNVSRIYIAPSTGNDGGSSTHIGSSGTIHGGGGGKF